MPATLKVPNSIPAIITSVHGRHYQVSPLPYPANAQETNISYYCYPRGKKSIYACGDIVTIELQANQQGVIIDLTPRYNLLWRSDAFKQKLIAANLTQMIIVLATEPSFSDLFISRCLCAAEHSQLQVTLVLNKSDLRDDLTPFEQKLRPFIELGYHYLPLSAHQDVTPLAKLLHDEKSILVGPSGVGKTSITNQLIPNANAATREISTVLDSGKHTTTYAQIYPFGQGWLIDSPGLQQLGLAHLSPAQLVECFIEFKPFLGLCQFRNCTHKQEPKCAILSAVEHQQIHENRYAHYRQILDEIEFAHKTKRGW